MIARSTRWVRPTRLHSTLAAVALALCSSVALAEGGGPEDPDGGKPGCREMGCSNGVRTCGTVTMTSYKWFYVADLALFLPDEQTHTCYESASF